MLLGNACAADFAASGICSLLPTHLADRAGGPFPRYAGMGNPANRSLFAPGIRRARIEATTSMFLRLFDLKSAKVNAPSSPRR